MGFDCLPITLVFGVIIVCFFILFCRCIQKWLKGQGGKCPQCNEKAKHKDIRVIYAKTIMVRLVLGHMVDVLSPSIYCNGSYHSLLLVVSIAEL